MAIGRRTTVPYAGAFDPTRFVTSWCLPPGVLFGIRTLLAVYAFTTLFTIFGWNGSHGNSDASRHSFSFFTNLTYWGLAFYYAFSAAHTGSYWLTGTSFLSRWPKVLQVAHSMFYSTIVVYPWIVTIELKSYLHSMNNKTGNYTTYLDDPDCLLTFVFWGLLADRIPTTFSLWSNTSEHALNSAYAFFEIVFPRTERLPWFDLIPVVILLALYLGLAYLTHATEGFYVYPFLDLQKNSPGVVAGFIVGILVAAIIVFLIVRYLIVLRVWVVEERLGKLGKFSKRGEVIPTSGGAKDLPLEHIIPK